MGKNTPWSKSDKRKVSKMYLNGASIREIAAKLNRTYSSISTIITYGNLVEKRKIKIQKEKDKLTAEKEKRKSEMKRINDEKKAKRAEIERINREIVAAQDKKRTECHARGLSDTDSAEECGISYAEYRHWRRQKGLPINPDIDYSTGKKKQKEPTVRGLKVEDLIHYHRNNNNRPLQGLVSDIKVTVDKELAERLASQYNVKPITAKLEERQRIKFKDHLYVTAIRNFGGPFVREG